MDREKILDKIKKCLALSQSPEPAEAAAALRQAQKLMELHGISAAEMAQAEIGEANVKSAVSVSRIKDWELKLLNLVAKAFGCRLLWTRSSSWRSGADIYGKCTIIGLKHQVELAQYTAQVMQRKLVKARAEFVNSLSSRLTRGAKTVEADGFCHGWVEAISKTVHAFALSKEMEKVIDDAVSARSAGKAKVQQRQAGQFGYGAGHQAGSGESINRPLNERQQHLRLGN